jgi:hypothetical protein
MSGEYFDPPWDCTDVVLVNHKLIGKIEQHLTSCEGCNPSAEISLEYILDQIFLRDPSKTEYVLERPAKCRTCEAEICEKTLVAWDD